MRPRALATRRLLLRPPRAGHASSIFGGYASDPLVTRFLRWSPHGSPAETRAYLRDLELRLRAGEELAWLLCEKPGARVVGAIGLVPGDGEAELGFVLGRGAWGRGLAAEAGRAVIAYAFGELCLRRVFAACDVDNHASRRVLQKLGLELQRRVPRHSVHPAQGRQPRDCFLYAIDRTPTGGAPR